MSWIESLWLLVLVAFSIEDAKTRKISVLPILFFIPCLLFAIFGREQMEWTDCMGGILVGLLFCAVSHLKKESIGIGDGVIILLLGVSLGARRVLYILVIAFFLTALAAGVLFLLHKADKKTRLPFIPFLLGGYIVEICWFMSKV